MKHNQTISHLKQFLSQYKFTLFNSSLGNILEWYDFGLFAIFSTLFSRLFFPSSDSRTALITTFSLFAIGFICRPLGAIIFGYFGDKIGRAKTLRMSILMISLPTFAIALLPTYQSIGITAPVLLLLIRMWQGISIGGEYSGNLIYLAETAPTHYRATCTSFASMGANLGILLAALVGIASSQLMSEQVLERWGWRLPYLISGLFCIGMYIFRLQLTETQTFSDLQQHRLLARNPIATMFTDNFPQLLRTLGLVCMGSTFYYFCFVYIPIYVSKNTTATVIDTSLIISMFIALMIILVPLAGWLCDYIGRRKMLLFNAALISVCTIPGYYLLHCHCLLFLIPVLFIFTIASSLEQGTTSVAVVENFPPVARYSGVSLGYNIGNGILGGTVPMVCEWLSSNNFNSLAPAVYITLYAVLTGLVVFFFVGETKGEDISSVHAGEMV